jgi:copper chaperone
MQQFHIPDMTCKHCEATINSTIKELDASANITVDLPNHVVSIESKQDGATLEAAIREAGFTPANI